MGIVNNMNARRDLLAYIRVNYEYVQCPPTSLFASCADVSILGT